MTAYAFYESPFGLLKIGVANGKVILIGPYAFQGTSFQQAVWAQIAKIPYGRTVTYKDIAQAIGKPRAFQATGRAVGANPLAILIPCHRVIGSNGEMTGYAYGLEMKKTLLDLESTSSVTCHNTLSHR